LTPLAPSTLVHSKAKINFAASKEEAGQEIYVFYSEEASVGIKTMRKYGHLSLPHAPSESEADMHNWSGRTGSLKFWKLKRSVEVS